MLGAYKILHGQSIYYYSLGHGDTYGPINYLAYVPFEWLWPGNWGYLPAARAATITFDLLTLAGLIALGTRLRRGRDGWRLGLAPRLAVRGVPVEPARRGEEHQRRAGRADRRADHADAVESPSSAASWSGWAPASKFFPAILLPLVAVGRGNADQQTVRKVLAGFVITVGASIAFFLPPGGVQEMWNHTIGFQLTRTDVFSIWALHPALAPIKDARRGIRGGPRGGWSPSARAAHARRRRSRHSARR